MMPLVGESLDFSFYFQTAVEGLNRTVLHFNHAVEGQHEQIKLNIVK